VKASERVGIQTTDSAVYLCYGGEGVLPKVDGAIYAPCAREDSDGLDRGKVGVTRAVKFKWIHTERGSEERRCTLMFLCKSLSKPRLSERPTRCQRTKKKEQPRMKAMN